MMYWMSGRIVSQSVIGARYAVQDGNLSVQAGAKIHVYTQGQRGHGEDGGPVQARLAEASTHAPGAVQERPGCFDAVEFRVEIVEPDARGHSAAARRPVQPRLEDPQPTRCIDVAHDVRVADVLGAEFGRVVVQYIEESRQAGDARNAAAVRRDLQV